MKRIYSATLKDMNNDEQITWEAFPYEHREHSADWYWAVGIIALSLAIAFFIMDNALLSIIIILGIGTFLIRAKNPPMLTKYALSSLGVHAGKTLHPWETLKSFWITATREKGAVQENHTLLLTPKKTLAIHIVIPLSTETSLQEIHAALSHILPEEPQAEPVAYRLMRVLGF